VPIEPGSVRSVQAAAFARCDQGGDHAPRDRLAAPQLPGRRRGPDDAEPAAADVPAADTDLGSGELLAAQLPEILLSHNAGDGSQMRSCSASRRAAIRTSARIRTLTMTARARATLDDHRHGRPSSAHRCGSALVLPEDSTMVRQPA
jgi:hypothetical protein